MLTNMLLYLYTDVQLNESRIMSWWHINTSTICPIWKLEPVIVFSHPTTISLVNCYVIIYIPMCVFNRENNYHIKRRKIKTCDCSVCTFYNVTLMIDSVISVRKNLLNPPTLKPTYILQHNLSTSMKKKDRRI